MSLWVTVDFFHCIHCSPGTLACCRPATIIQQIHNCSFRYIIEEDFRGDTTIPCSASYRVILAMLKSLTLHWVIPFGPSPSPLPINWSEFSLLLPQAFLCLRSAGTQAPSQISRRGLVFLVHCSVRRGSGSSSRGCSQGFSRLISKHGCAPRFSFMGPQEPRRASPFSATSF